MDEIKVNAVMLRAIDYLENDKILTLFTAERGRITAGIKGVKKAGAKLKFAAQPFCFAEYILTGRGGRYTVINASENESFYDIRTDVCKYYAAASCCEAVIALTGENDADEELFSLLVRTLSDMCTGEEGQALVTFYLSLLKLSGYALTVGDCAECGAGLKASAKLRFNADTGSFTCFNCGTGAGVSAETYHSLRRAGGQSYNEKLAANGVKKALKLLLSYTAYKTEQTLPVLTQYIEIL